MRFAGKVFALVYSVWMVFILLAFMTLFFTRTVLSEKFLASALSKLDYGAITVKALGLDEFAEKYGQDATFEDVITTELENLGIDTETADKIFNDKNLQEFIGGMASELIDAGVNSTELDEVTEAEIEEALGVLDLSKENYQKVTDYLNDFIVGFNKEIKNGSGV